MRSVACTFGCTASASRHGTHGEYDQGMKYTVVVIKCEVKHAQKGKKRRRGGCRWMRPLEIYL